MSKLSFLVYSPSPETRTRVVDQLVGTGRVTVGATITDLQALSDALRGHRADGIYLDLDEDADEVLEAIAMAPDPRPAVLLGARAEEGNLILRAMRLGAKDFYTGHVLSGVENALETITPHRTSSDRAAPILAVVGAKGGVGATTLACELGVALQEAGLQTIVCDLSRQLGDVALYFDLTPRFDIVDLVRQEGELDSVFMNAVIEQHESQVSILAAPSKLEDVNFLSTSRLDKVLKFLQNIYDCIILDIPWDFDEFALRALDMSNEIIIVTNSDVTSLTHARTRRQLIERFGALPERVHMVLNRLTSQASIDVKQVVEFLERELDAVIPDQPQAARKCTDEGRILREVPEGQAMRSAIFQLRDRTCEWCQFELAEEESSSGDGKLMARLRGLIGRK